MKHFFEVTNWQKNTLIFTKQASFDIIRQFIPKTQLRDRF